MDGWRASFFLFFLELERGNLRWGRKVEVSLSPTSNDFVGGFEGRARGLRVKGESWSEEEQLQPFLLRLPPPMQGRM